MKSNKNSTRRENQETTILFVLPVAALPVVTWFLWQKNPDVFEENHLVEWAQAVFLFGAAAIHGYRAAGKRTARDRVPAIFHAALAVLCLSLFAREVDVDQLGTQAIWPWIETIFRMTVVLLWIGMIAVAVRMRRNLWQSAELLFLSRGSFFAYAGILFYLVSWFFDKGILPLSIEMNLYFEETLQLLAALFFVLGALRHSATTVGARR